MANSLEQRVRELEDRLARFERDNTDAMENIERSNLSTEFSQYLKKLEARIKALENA